jgi:hypothetical protein
VYNTDVQSKGENMSLGHYDPDWEESGKQKRPGWATPKTPLAIMALSACGRKYFQGQTKHNSEFAEWDAEEEKCIGATDGAVIHKAWILNCIEWAKKQNALKLTIKFGSLLHLIQSNDHMIDWKMANANKILNERGKDVVEKFNNAATLARKANEEKD